MRTHAQHRSTSRRRIVGTATAAAALALGSLGLASPAAAVPDRLKDSGDVVAVVKDAAQRVAPPPAAAPPGGSRPASPLARTGSSEPAGGDASGRAVGLGIGGSEIAVIGESSAGGGTQGTQAESRSLAVLGTTVVGSEAEKATTPERPGKPSRERSGDFLLPLCEGTGGALCAELLYADSTSSATRSEARSGLLHVCLGGDDPSGDTCSGPIEASVLTSDAFHVVRGNGTQTTGAGSEVLGLCLTSTGDACDLGISLLGSDGTLTSDGGSDQESSIIDAEVLGFEGGDGGAGEAIGIPSCGDAALICLALNQDEADQREDGTVVLGGSPLSAGVLSDGIAAALASNESSTRAAGDGGGSNGGGGGGQGGSGTSDGTDSPSNAGGIPGDGGLPGTGGPALPLLLLGLALIAGGALVRRRT